MNSPSCKNRLARKKCKTIKLTNTCSSFFCINSYYDRHGALIEDLTDDYLATAAGGIAPIPVVVSTIMDVEALKAAAVGPVTVARVAKPSDVFAKALRWNNQYDAMPTYTSRCENVLFHAVLYSKPSICPDRLGTNIGKC